MFERRRGRNRRIDAHIGHKGFYQVLDMADLGGEVGDLQRLAYFGGVLALDRADRRVGACEDKEARVLARRPGLRGNLDRRPSTTSHTCQQRSWKARQPIVCSARSVQGPCALRLSGSPARSARPGPSCGGDAINAAQPRGLRGCVAGQADILGLEVAICIDLGGEGRQVRRDHLRQGDPLFVGQQLQQAEDVGAMLADSFLIDRLASLAPRRQIEMGLGLEGD